MKKFMIMMIVCLLIVTPVFAGSATLDTLEKFMFTEVEAMGGASTAISNGFEALFNNPAGFSRRGGELVFTSLNFYADLIPDPTVFAPMESLDPDTVYDFDDIIDHYDVWYNGDEDAFFADLSKLGIQDGITIGGNVGAGLSAFGLGAGIITEYNIYSQAYDMDSIKFEGILKSEAVLGLSHKFDMGPASLSIGANLKGLAMGTFQETDLKYALINDTLSQSDAELAAGYGFDAGAILDLPGGLSAGISVENIGDMDLYWIGDTAENIGDMMETLEPDGLYEYLVANGSVLTFPMTAKVGLGYETPRGHMMGLRLAADYELDLDTLLAADKSIVIEEPTLIEQLQLGAEVSLLGIAKVRGGLNKGRITAGAGINLLLVEVNATYFGDYVDEAVKSRMTYEDLSEELMISAKVKI